MCLSRQNNTKPFWGSFLNGNRATTNNYLHSCVIVYPRKCQRILNKSHKNSLIQPKLCILQPFPCMPLRLGIHFWLSPLHPKLACCFTEFNDNSQVTIPSCGRVSSSQYLWAASCLSWSRLSLYTLKWLLIVEQIAALQHDTVLAARKGLTGLSWINNQDPNMGLLGSCLLFVQSAPALGGG